MVLAPEYMLSGIVCLHCPVSGAGELSAHIDTRYAGKQYFDLNNPPVATEHDRAVTNFSVGLDGERWSGSAWVRNVTNRECR